MKLIVLAAAAATMMSAPSFAAHGNGNARSGAASPTVTNENPSSCLGAERASRNSRGGDRDQGGFGQAQSDYIALINDGGTDFENYGEALAAFRDTCDYAPGSDD